MYLSEFNRLHGLRGITPQQHAQCQADLLNLMVALNQENYAWSLAASSGEAPPSSDQHNATVYQLQQQIAAAQACLAQPVDAPPPAPAPAPAAAPAPAPRAPAPAPAPAPRAPIVPTPGGTQTDTSLIPYDVDVPSVTGGQGTVYGPGGAPADDKGGAGWLLLLLGGAAMVVGGG